MIRLNFLDFDLEFNSMLFKLNKENEKKLLKCTNDPTWDRVLSILNLLGSDFML